MPFRLLFGSVLSCAALLAVLMPAANLSAAPPVLRQSDGAPGEGGPLDGTRLEFAQKDAGLPEQDEPSQTEDVSPEGDDPIDEGVSITLDATDHLAPVDKALQTAWRRAVQATRQKNWPKVLQHLAPIIGRPDGSATEDAMIRLPDATLRSASLEAARLLLNLPEELRSERSRQLESAGNAALKRAPEDGNLRELQRVAMHFAGTPAGDAAADQLIALAVDRGHFGLASAWSAVLTDADTDASRTVSWQRRDELIQQVLTRSEHRRPGYRATKDDTSPTRHLARELTPDAPETLSEWSLIGGNTRRHAVVQSGTPTLVKRWSSVSTSDPRLAARIDQMIEDLSYDGRSSVPVGVPLFISGRMALRTLRGIEVRDVQTGRLLWTAGERKSLETLLGGADRTAVDAEFDDFDNGLFAVNELNQEFEAADPTGGALGQAIFQNATYGFLSSDGDRLFAILDDPVYSLGRTSVRNRNGRNVSPEPGSASANRLEAFDLKSGHLLWRLGGPETGEPASAPLAGWFFLGSPLATNDGLFVVAQNSETIRLFCLDAETGRVRWSQRIGWSDDRLDRDLNRRLWAALPSLANGVLVCPTSAGWVVGVDSLTGTLLWAHRFSTRAPEGGNGPPGLFLRNRGMLEVANRRVDSHWVAAPPVVAGTSVLLTPPETKDVNDPSTGIIVCLDLFSGRKLWELPRRDANQLAAVTERVAVLASSRSLDALTLDGRPAWKFVLPDDAGQISGRVLASADTLFVPTQSGDVFVVAIETGKLRQQLSPSEDQRLPGSLYSYNGLLVSVHPAEVTAFELQSTLEQKLRQNAETQSPRLLIQRAQLALARGDSQEARKALQAQTLETAAEADRAAFDAVVLKTASELRKAGPGQSLEFLDATPQASDSTGASAERAALEVQLLQQSGRRLDAFRRLMEIAEAGEFDQQTLRQSDDSRLATSVSNWLQLSLADTWSSLTPDDRRLADADVRRLFADRESTRVSVTDPARGTPVGRLAAALVFHGEGQTTLAKLARQADEDGRRSDAVLWWTRIRTAATGPELNVEAQLRLSLHEFPLLTERDRDWRLATIGQRISDSGLSRSEPLLHLLDAAARLHRDLSSQVRSLHDNARLKTQLTVKLQRLPSTDVESKSQFLTDSAGQSIVGPRFSAMLVSHDFEGDHLAVVDHVENGRTWSVPIGSVASARTPLIVRRVGTVLLTLQNRRLLCLSIADRRVLWTLTLGSDPLRSQHNGGQMRPMVSGKDWIEQLEEHDGVLSPSGSGQYLCCRTERELLVIEIQTGRVCWRRKGVQASLNAVIDGEAVVLIDARRRPHATYRLADGRSVENADQRPVVPSVLRRDFSGTVTADIAGDVIAVRQTSDGKSVWDHQFPADAGFHLVGDTTLAVMKSRGHFETLDLRTGEVSSYVQILADRRIGKNRVTLIPDDNRWLLLLQGSQLARASLGSLQSINAQGTFVSFDRKKTDAEPWYYDAGQVGLPLNEVSRLPFLILLRETRSPLLRLAKTRHLTLLDRRTGTPAVDPSGKLIDDLTMPGDASFSGIAMPHNAGHVELQSGTERLRLTVRGSE